MKRRSPYVLAGLMLVFQASPAQAQGFPGGGLGPGLGNDPQPIGPSGAPPSGAPKPDPNQPETHAASGASDSLVPAGNEPSLPRHPLRMRKKVSETIGTDATIDEFEIGRSDTTYRKPYGLYYEEGSGDFRFRTIFPLWFERTQPSLSDPTQTDRASLFGGFYYNRRSATVADDIVFPLFWNLRRPGSRTTVLGPFVNRVAQGETDNWLAPLYFTGTRETGSYTIVPPLLTYLNNTGDGGFNLLGPAFCIWSKGEDCDTRTADDIDLGIAPLYFHGRDQDSQYTLVPPLLHYYTQNDRDLSWLDIWGPYYREHTEKRDMLHLLPLFYSITGEDEGHYTLLPFGHYGWKGNSNLLVTPFFLNANGEDGESTFATYLYARHRGRTELDMITPLYWDYRDPDIGLKQKILFPFLYTRTSPREENTVFFPFWAHFERFGISETTWITPFFRHSHDLRGWSTNIHPFLFLGRDGYDSHTVVAPFFWDFASRDSRATVGFPLFWRFSDENSIAQLIGNAYYHEKRVAHGLDWEFHFFPVFSYGETPNGHWWNILYGLGGYTRRGEKVQVRTFWIPITVSGGD